MAKHEKNLRKQVIASEVVQIPLLPEHVTEIKSLVTNIGQVVTEVFDLTKSGYSVNIMFDAEKETYSVRLAGVTEGEKNSGHLLYGNGKTWELAFASVYVKHFLISKGGTWVNTSQASLDVS
jgi:hypothetical protein